MPRKAGPLRDRRVNLRLTPAEYQEVVARAAQAGVAVGVYARSALLRRALKRPPEGFRAASRQLQGAAGNLNQVSHNLHLVRLGTLGPRVLDEAVAAAAAEVRDCAAEIRRYVSSASLWGEVEEPES